MPCGASSAEFAHAIAMSKGTKCRSHASGEGTKSPPLSPKLPHYFPRPRIAYFEKILADFCNM